MGVNQGQFTDTLCHNVPCSFFNTLKMSEQNIPERGGGELNENTVTSVVK